MTLDETVVFVTVVAAALFLIRYYFIGKGGMLARFFDNSETAQEKVDEVVSYVFKMIEGMLDKTMKLREDEISFNRGMEEKRFEFSQERFGKELAVADRKLPDMGDRRREGKGVV